MTSSGLLHGDLSGKVINCVRRVYGHLGSGFLEKVYENALVVELQSQGLQVQQQVPLTVEYRGVIVGEYVADMVVEGKILLELKAASQITDAHKAQLLNYLKASGIEVGFIINFGEQFSYDRKVYTRAQSRGDRQR